MFVSGHLIESWYVLQAWHVRFPVSRPNLPHLEPRVPLVRNTEDLSMDVIKPARPTLIVIGLTRALLAKFWIFFGIVAENSRVCRWAWRTSIGRSKAYREGQWTLPWNVKWYCARLLRTRDRSCDRLRRNTDSDKCRERLVFCPTYPLNDRE